jgi:hypothetical protein
MDIILQYFDGCPNWKTTDHHLRTLIHELELDARYEYQLIDSPAAAETHRFRGSPTVLIDGADPFAAPDAPIGLACRVYPTAEGPAGSPTRSQLKAILGEARPS